MIDQAVYFISGFLNNELRLALGIDESRVMVSNLVDPDGSPASKIKNKIVITVINIEHETARLSPEVQQSGQDNAFGRGIFPVHLNLHLLVSAHCNSENYMEALKMLSTVIGVFQSQAHFTPRNYPDLPESLNQLSCELYNLSLEQQSHVWSALGVKQVPFVVYKLRMISNGGGAKTRQISGVTDQQTSVIEQSKKS